MGRRSAILPIRVRPLSTWISLVPSRATAVVSAPLCPYVKKPYGYDRKDSTNRVKGVIFRSRRQEKD